jgi:Protein of unknown function (DUF2851)
MSESFLHYVWQFQYFDKYNLLTTEKEKLVIYKTGTYNTDSGPDFSHAKLKIGTMDWVGNIEIHIKSSDWMAHQHHHDDAYENVILHVVWENDKPIERKDGSLIPTIELKNRISHQLINNYRHLVNSPLPIACEQSIKRVEPIIKTSMIEQAAMRRLEAKSTEVKTLLKANQGDWEETTYQWLAKGFGFKINAEPFYQLAKSLPYRLIRKHSNNLLQIEALLFGQAGLLTTKTKNEYSTSLFSEYRFLRAKYSLEPVLLPSQWKFLRLRPANFPTLRIAQFASLLHAQQALFSKIAESNVADLIAIFDASPSPYWHSHYHFSKLTGTAAHAMGSSSKQILLINSVAPILLAYGKQVDDQYQVDSAVELLQQLPAEKNKIITVWNELGIEVKSAFESQGLIEQYNQMCLKRQCLNCAIGSSLVRP